MKHVDMRKLAPAAQEERRRQVIGLRQSGVSYAAIAAQVGLSQTGVFDICKRFADKGKKGLVSGKRGRKPDEQKLLDATQEKAIKRLICRHMPDALGLDFALWSRDAVRTLIQHQYGVRLAVRTTGKYLARWGFTAQKPLRRAYERNPAEVRHWLRYEYPAICRPRACVVPGAILPPPVDAACSAVNAGSKSVLPQSSCCVMVFSAAIHHMWINTPVIESSRCPSAFCL
jgi:transposase